MGLYFVETEEIGVDATGKVVGRNAFCSSNSEILSRVGQLIQTLESGVVQFAFFKMSPEINVPVLLENRDMGRNFDIVSENFTY